MQPAAAEIRISITYRHDVAQERTRTFTAVKPLAPEASASTNSATWARAGYYGSVARLSNSRKRISNGLYSTDMMAYRETAKYPGHLTNLTLRKSPMASNLDTLV